MAISPTFLRHPLVMFALGAATGVLAYKYRKEIAGAVSRASDAGRDFMLHQKESLNDLLEEAREAEATGNTAATPRHDS
ncbi:hypothetical protein SIID45300_00482 [Candidatus Magnetaquicoccaceae bacterium FCR-1]|uniref:Secreted protein n=1 Tax=Candidatus Magnetaquiglobus chichijimensis TaxID=3141448 RepID=A0ABQ0C5P2_9PROT